MRKNNFFGKKGRLKHVFCVEGLNLNNLINLLQKKGVSLSQVKITGEKRLILTVDHADVEKFFAITQNLCYNIKRLKYSGVFAPAYRLIKRAGIIVGAFLFFALSATFSDLICSVEFTGSGSVYSREISKILASEGVTVFSRFSAADLPSLSDKIAAGCNGLSFAECRAQGNRLIVYSAIANRSEVSDAVKTDAMYSDVSGVIVYIKVYSGTPLKTAGDRVEKGEKICDGQVLVRGNPVNAGVIAVVRVAAEYVYEYESEKAGEEDVALILARVALGEKDVLSENVETTERESGYLYRVTLEYGVTQYSGKG